MIYLVSFEIDIDDADTPRDAALSAWKYIVRSGSTANVFDVTDERGNTTRVDLQEEWESELIDLESARPSGRDEASMPEWSPLQQSILTAYEGGEFSGLAPEALNDCGDGLLRFLMMECSPAEDCLSLKDASQRIATAIRQLCEVSNLIE